MPLGDLIACIVQIAVLAYLLFTGTRMAFQNRDTPIYKLLAGAFGCYLLGTVFWLVHFYIVQDWPQGFSAADLSFNGHYCFLLAANLSLIENWTAEQKLAARKRRLPALAAPVVVLLFHIAYQMLYEHLINNLISFVTLSLWGYFTLWPLWTVKKSPARRYYGIIMLAFALELIINLAGLFDDYTWYYIFSYAQMAGWLFILPAARKAVEA